MPTKQTINQSLTNLEITEGDYDLLRLEVSSITVALAACISNHNLDRLPEALNRLKEFLTKIDGKYIEFFRRPLNCLHSILISRMYYNKTFKSPIYEYDLLAMTTYASSETEFRNLYAIYISAIEDSLVVEA